jgi:thioredoxin reductase (NADPH)
MKIEGRKEEPERTSVDNIYALGDILEGVPELMPIAQKSGRLLAHRIYHRTKGDMSEQDILKRYSMDYDHIPTTIFSTVEYSFVGLNEEEATKQYGKDNIEIYHREVTPLEVSIYHANATTAYMKVICERTEDEKVLGIHYLGPSAGEVINGFAVAMKLGLKKSDLDRTVGIHPTVSEDLLDLDITKRSGKDYIKTGC